ncbi:MAG: ATP synthase F0 subunit A [Ilumatobacter coccineus]|uniref:ATP synthase subunit a n=1 Tax=Ilumatobacter coccineus TaxID=467094 RepID=A0A2G6K7H3_9ACTN|nr:MAG: ATP synthase F0 subunit A [Ilumatobacter coccineus]
MLGLEFPGINEVIRWVDLFPTFNKIALIAVAATLIGSWLFIKAAKTDHTVAPTGVRNFAEVTVEFIEEMVLETIGREGLKWTPYMLALFIFIYLCNLPGIIPVLYMPATARMAIPLFLAVLVWLIYIGVGIRHQGIRYFTHMLWPPGVPTFLKPLVGVIEIVSNIFVRPFALAIRLFANMLAGHMLLVTFSVLTHELILGGAIAKPIAILPFFMLLFVTAFEVLVGFLQAYIFTILACVFIASSLESHDEHDEAPAVTLAEAH